MMYVLSGLVVAGGGTAGLVYMLPRNGRVHPLARMPPFDWFIPVSILSMVALGVGLIVSGLGA